MFVVVEQIRAAKPQREDQIRVPEGPHAARGARAQDVAHRGAEGVRACRDAGGGRARRIGERRRRRKRKGRRLLREQILQPQQARRRGVGAPQDGAQSGDVGSQDV